MPKISILVFLIALHIKLGIISNNIIYSNITNSLLRDAPLLITDSIINNNGAALTIILKNLFIIIISLGLFIYPYYYLYNFEPRSGGQAIDINFISQFKGIFFCNPIISICLTISLF